MNKKRIIHGFAAIYVVAYLLVAHSSLVTLEATVTNRADRQAQVGASEDTLWHCDRLDGLDTTAEDGPAAFAGADRTDRTDDPAVDRSEYTIRFWGSRSCSACRRYKREEIPIAEKAGFKVETKDYATDGPPDYVKSLPTIELIYDGEVIAIRGYWKVKDIDKFIVERLKLKDK